MMIRYFLLLTALVYGTAAATADTRSAAETLGAFVGDWQMELVAEQRTFGERGGPGTGKMSCVWGPMETWVDCELDSAYQGLGRYVMKIILYRTGHEDSYGSFVTNSFGGGRLYTGKWASDNRLVYEDAWVDPRRKWPHQRVTYTFDNAGRMSFVIEVSGNGQDYEMHSRGTYRRQ